MSNLHKALLLAASLAIACVQTASAEPPLRQRWRPSTVPSAPVPLAPYVAPQFLPGAEEGNAAAGQVAYVDPVTGALLSTPPAGAKSRPDFVSLPAVSAPMRAGRTPEGFLFIQTNGHHETLSASLDAQGMPHLRCGDASHGHPVPVAAPAESRR